MYFDKSECGDAWQRLDVRVVERAGRVRRVDVGDPEDDSGRLRRPIRRREREAVVRTGVHRISLFVGNQKSIRTLS